MILKFIKFKLIIFKKTKLQPENYIKFNFFNIMGNGSIQLTFLYHFRGCGSNQLVDQPCASHHGNIQFF